MDSDHTGAFSEVPSPANLNPESEASAVSTALIETKFENMETPSAAGKDATGFPAAYWALLIAALVAAGSYAILPIWLLMGQLWLNDPLRAIGAAFPLLAFAGTIAAWRRIGWIVNGTWWGLPIVALSILMGRFTSSLIFVLKVHGRNETMMHPGVVMFLYGVGAVLLFGGPRLLRAAIAPLCLLLLVDPVPHSYNALVDLPLQFLSANTARHFAHLIGLQPTGQQLRMMFAPDFGMQIVPGCNGVRGSVTLGYLALIFGYVWHLRPRALALTTLGAFLMGYALNLLRLCTLVIYYRIGLSHPSIQPYGAGVDYGIGCTLFLFATLGVGLFIRWIEPDQQKSDNAAAMNAAPTALPAGYGTVARTICFVILTLAFSLPMLSAGTSLRVAQPNEQALLNSFPAQVGAYHLVRTYDEKDGNGLIQFALADYSSPQDGTEASKNITLGLYVGLGVHYVAYSKFAQGIRPEWTGSLEAMDDEAQSPLKIQFATTLFDDGIRREYNAESVCTDAGCSASVDSNAKRFYFSAPKFSDMVVPRGGSRLTILLRREWPDSDGTSAAAERTQFESETKQFTQQLDLRALLRADGNPI